jgi:hyperosmotically inducible protein
MKFRTLIVAGAVMAAAGLTGCDRAPDDRTSSQPPPTGPVTKAPAAPTAPGAAPVAPAPDRSAGRAIDDAGITAKVKAALLAEKGVNGTSIDVDTSQGAVTLSGRVPDQSQVDRAVEVARNIEGVKAVNNNLSVGAG